MKKRLNRMLSTLLICSMVMTMMPTTVFATNRKDAVMEEYAGGLCEHHPEHDEECGYSEGIAGTACSHEHTDDCYREVIDCTHRHDEDCYPGESIWDDEATPSDADRLEPEYCSHICDEESGCVTKKLKCQHEHDDECGYSSTTRGTSCEFVCEICGVEDNMEMATPSNAKAVTVASVQAMIDALPDAEKVRKDNAEEVKAQLDAIDDAKAELSDEEIDELDLSHYMEVAAALEQLLYGVATQSNAVMLADYDGPAIQLGTGGISGPTEEEEDGKGSYYVPNSYIYFGVNSGNSSTPIKWRVLDADTANDGTTSGMFLLSEYLLASDVQFRYNESIDNAYQGSAAQFWCGLFLSNRLNFSTVEQDAMLGLVKTDSAEDDLYSISWGESSLTATDKLFFLSVQELADYVGNYLATPGMAATNTSLSASEWWLRSPYAYVRTAVGTVFKDGNVRYSSAQNYWAARPAFNLDLNAVLFTSAAEGGKSDVLVDSNLTEVGTGSTEWKLTLKDTSRSFNASASNTLVRVGENLTVTYSGAGTGEKEYVSAMLADNSGNILYYGRIAQNSANGTASVEIPSDLTAGTYTLKVFSEQYNGDYKTDYASEFQDITLTVNGKVSEQFNLTPGTTYWFDLSSAGIPGSTNNALPDTSRHYVPFTYVGSLNAYVLKPASENVLTSSEEASQATDKDAKYGYTYKHSLFIADYNVTHGISWKILNDNKLIFGTDFQNNRVAYTLRAPSAGHTYAYGDNGGSTPDNNEWDTILKKANQSTQTNVSDYIKNWEGIWSYGQDTANTSAFRQYRTIRGRIISAFSCNMEHKAESLPKYGFRPILEILDADTLGYDGLKTIVLDLNDGKIGDTTGTVNIVVKNSESFTAPESSGLSSPIGKTDTDFCWQGSDGNSYIPGADVPAGVTSLTAQWTPMTYTVMLETNGGTIADGKDVISYTYGAGATLPTENDITREGYTFEGWYADSSFSGTPVTEISSDDMGNKEFYAKWMRNTTPIIPGDTVNYVVEHYKASDNGYTLEETEKLGDKIGSNVTAEPKIYTGYTYNPDAVGSVSMGTLKKISSAADIVTLKLYYDLTVYTVTVENDGNGSASAAPVSATMGEKITLTVTPNSGYRFKEWQIVSGDVTISDDTFTMPAGNVVVKAVFERKSSDGGGRDSSSDRDTSSSAIRKDPIKGRISSDRGIITGAANSTANDGYSHWMQNEHGWWLRFADNSYPKGRKHGTSGSAYAWEYINGSWWAFDENGYAKTGWLRDEAFGGWFYMDPERGMQTGWVLIDGVWYYFHPVSDGRRGIMYAGQKTPDGYYVDEKGAWDGKEK
ncbi:InlB B-repeat-containing protein [Lacrimispora indolis]|uniref:InlB B-repeat-containing protein n=1 Tax=Lacrimispora indolis TaxID=69825 RepID=UPI003566579A